MSFIKHLIHKSQLVGSAALAIALLYGPSAAAQTASRAPADSAKSAEDASDDDIVVSSSRINRVGFDQPTPTTVVGATELRQGARPTIQQVLNDLPQFRQTVAPQATIGNLVTGTASIDLRGLGVARTLTLIDGRRFAGENNLNFVPVGLVDRVEVVTGSASAAWGSGAVAGVVNILLKKDLEGLSLGAQSGISSRGDSARYGLDGAFGTGFAGGKGHFILGVEYVDDKGVLDRNARPNLGSAGIVRVNPLSTTDLSTVLVRDVNYGNFSRGGLITTGILAGQTFQPDGTLSTFQSGTKLGSAAFPSQMLGGADGVGLYDDVPAVTPINRLNVYGRLSFELGKATIWAEASYGRATSNAKIFPDYTIPALTISATNPFLSSTIRTQLANAGQTSFTLGRVFDDYFEMTFNSQRINKEISAGISGSLGDSFTYKAYFTHGQVNHHLRVANSRLTANFANAINAVSSGGQIVCAVNADAITTNDAPGCVPLNPFGQFSASPAAIAYVSGTQISDITTKLDAGGAQIQGDLFSLWAGPATLVVGAEARRESQVTTRGAQDIAGLFAVPLFTSNLSGHFDVKEGFAELALPVADITETLKLDLGAAARYSDYSTSGGIWSWKLGGTARLFDALLLRVARSRDIRSPSIGDLYGVRTTRVGPLVDQDTAGRVSVAGYNPAPATVTTYTGGNPGLQPEVSRTWTVGGAFSPRFLPGFNASIDYYDISIEGAIASLSGSNLTLACARGSVAACAQVVRDPTTQTVTTVYSTVQNISKFQTSGMDFELSYRMPMTRISASIPGTFTVRALATRVHHFIIDTGITRVDTAGDVGDASAIAGVPKWRGTLSFSWQSDSFGLDTRIRYVNGGLYNHLLTTLVNNSIASRTYLDLGAQVRVAKRFEVFANVNNVFDRDPPISTVGNPHYDVMGTYFTMGARVKF